MAYFPFVPALDRRIVHTGTYSSGVTTWTLPCSAVGMNAIVLSSDFGVQAGTMIVPTSATGTTVTASGDYSAGAVAIGRTFWMNAELSQVFRRDFNGNADLSSEITIRSIETQHRDSGEYSIRNRLELRPDRAKNFVPPTGKAIDSVGKLRLWAPGRADKSRIFIESTSHKPVAIAGIEMLVDVDPLPG